MLQKLRSPNVYFALGSLLIFVLIQVLISMGDLNPYWQGIIFWGAAITMVSLGLNLIYGFNGQFSLGQYGFYAIGAYASADITFRWLHHDPSALVVVIVGCALALVFMGGVGVFLRRFYGVTTLAKFLFYLIATILGFYLAVRFVNPAIGPALYQMLNALPLGISQQIVFFLALVGGATLAGIVSYLFGIPVLELGSDYFGIATLGFTIIIKVLLDNTDTLLPFPEMKGARGMIGIPKWTTWPWVFFTFMAVVLVLRNILHSSTGRAILSVRENERAAELMGVDTPSNKVLAFVIGSVFAGLAGGIRAHDMAFLHPTMFGFLPSFNPLIIIVLGGLGSMTGTIITGFFWVILLEGVLRLYLPEGFETWRFVIYPLGLLVMMLLRPQGLMGKYEIPFLRRPLPPPRAHEVPQPEKVAPTAEEVTV
ncbi:MAG: branched-chain amino acid ABC transporter permease [Anaerolineae bacterium]|jgi:branched-chain amino acid transport system permease protein|nr:branched-chain amino acid ABC transporter permease [Anaerolineae bacterium]MDH7473147.1 branched-chain amino acid ABC transporter permease [Anaerolineae bacterium]